MTKSKAKATDMVAVKLSCIYSGDGESWSEGSVIEVDAAEAERLIGLGAAAASEEPAAAEEGDEE